jgi:hypothetical protein
MPCRPMRTRRGRLIREYQALLRNAEKLNMTGFIKLQVLSEYFGRDLEEWINESDNLRGLSQILVRDRTLFDEGERRKNHNSPALAGNGK